MKKKQFDKQKQLKKFPKENGICTKVQKMNIKRTKIQAVFGCLTLFLYFCGRFKST